MGWFPLHNHTHFSLLDGLSRPEQLAARLKECGHAGCAVTDHGTLAGVPSTARVLKSSGLKPVAGCEFYLCAQDATIRSKENRRLSHLCVLAKGQKGWTNLVKASSASNRPEFHYFKPRLDLERLASFARGEWIVFSGHPGSDACDAIFVDARRAYASRSLEEARSLVADDWKERVFGCLERYAGLFGRENFYVEIQRVDRDNMPASDVAAGLLREAARELSLPCVATADSHYPRREDAPDQRVLLCSALNVTLREVRKKLEGQEDFSLAGFFRSNNYHVPTLAEMQVLHTSEELAASQEIASRCCTPETSGPPLWPRFDCPDGRTADEQLRLLCEEGWDGLVQTVVAPERLTEYRERLERELTVISCAGLSPYFLIKHDVIQYARKELGCKIGEGRGSAAGCLVSYLSGITGVDPIRFGLMFERFYSYGRNVPRHVSFEEAPFGK